MSDQFTLFTTIIPIMIILIALLSLYSMKKTRDFLLGEKLKSVLPFGLEDVEG